MSILNSFCTSLKENIYENLFSLNVANVFYYTPLYVIFPICNKEASIFMMSHILSSVNIRTFIAERMSAKSLASSRPSQVVSPP